MKTVKERKTIKKSAKQALTGTATIVSNAKEATKQKYAEVKLATFVSTKMMWKSYALLIANYFNNEYEQNLDFIFTKLEELNSKKELSKKDFKIMEILVSLNELKYYVKNDDQNDEIDINLDLIQRDFFVTELDVNIYKGLIEESDKKYGHSISYLLRIYDLLISFVMNKQTREVFYKAVINNENKELKKTGHPVPLNEKVIRALGVKNYLSNKFKKKMKSYEY